MAKEGPLSCGAVVEVVLRIRVTDSWGQDCTIGQIRSQAALAATNMAEHLFAAARDAERDGVGTAAKFARLDRISIGRVQGITIVDREELR